jgi:ATPase family associated with various cellular activities (AAA)
MEKMYSIRPQVRSAGDTILNHSFRVYMSLSDMNSEGLNQGDYISITSETTGFSGVGIAWRSVENEGSANKSKGTTFVRVSEFLRNLYSFELKDKFSISKWKGKLQETDSITISRILQDEVDQKTASFAPGVPLFQIQSLLCSFEGIAVGGTFELAPYRAGKRGKPQEFRVEKIEPPRRDRGIMQPYVFDGTGEVKFGGKNNEREQSIDFKAVEPEFSGIVGHDNMFKLLKLNLNEAQPDPILIVGATGTGKSIILSRIKQASWGKVLSIRSSMLVSSKLVASLNQFCAEAASNQPALLLVDDLDELAPKHERSILVDELCQLINRPENCHIQVVATAKRRVDIHQQFRHLFHLTFDLHLPTADDRLAILKQLIPSGFTVADSILQYVVDRTHAFTGADLKTLWKETKQAIIQRQMMIQPATITRKRADQSFEKGLSSLFIEGQVLQQDFDLARSKVHASAMNEIYIDVPKISWLDIGGSDRLKAELQQISTLTTRVRIFLFSYIVKRLTFS